MVSMAVSSVPSSSVPPFGIVASRSPPAMLRAALDAMATGPMMRRASNHENSADKNSATVSPATFSCRSRLIVESARCRNKKPSPAV